MTTLRSQAAFDTLMDYYEQNYAALRVLLPKLSDWESERRYVLRAASGSLPEVLGRLEERHAYTTDIWLSYQLSSNHRLPLYVPDFSIRIYHDAQQAEVLQGRLKDYWQITIGEHTTVKSRFMVNQILNRWLFHLHDAQYHVCAAIDSAIDSDDQSSYQFASDRLDPR